MIVEQIYAAYPRKVGRGGALREIEKALKRLPLEANLKDKTNLEIAEMLLTTVRLFAASPAGKRQSFTPHPTTWFHQSRYLDDPEEWFHVEGSKQDDIARRNTDALNAVFGKLPDQNRTSVFACTDSGGSASVERLPRQLSLPGY